MASDPEIALKKIGFLLTPGFALMSVTSAIEPLRAANLLSDRILYELAFVSLAGGWMRSSVLGAFETQSLDESPDRFDILFVVAGGDPLRFDDPRTLSWLRRLDRRGVPLGGISGGAAVLSKAGVMGDRRFTVHWAHLDAMRESYPEALIERRLFVIDRDRYTCAGGMAPLDMMHGLITSDHGAALARAVSDWFIHTGVRQAEAAQQLSPELQYDLHHPALVALVNLVNSHIADPLTLEDLAMLCGVSVRHLDRLCKAHLGKSPMRFSRALRLSKAAELLRQSSLSIEAVAEATGFTNRSHFSRQFQGQFGVGPAGWRAAKRSPMVRQ
ncbi:GlxA family transcriptional regulator [Pseudosulfitobacter pseudonitzschiae]|uniref:Transcriptional regulator n=1 Tax=Pseudosulfitobacter pseudonitzschiae TaxID=1402135 RepID=A0A073IXB2_9RHOB|nr:GlxA family transcriptional regulator [Pseudosulfitobacter pseudonitzschiae]KEJ94260.1 transcriptional regulator [Pseudosulfitobacter pseudonitzschiae]MCA0137790.1 GlxA family transcriptional regulator [Pseudosulfitobacter pseudonitzschiae]MCD2329377.1 GlxA family transcriptional regulator [Pseudosulfitobacter pseudonitzschiae]MCD2353799.1 GlxA family transcriptional regulator [Pseudosulfitobacter pseudonitzschiae]MCI2213066.1 GlxA family transcriptional regulator [Pseudosulfitobacter pseud